MGVEREDGAWAPRVCGQINSRSGERSSAGSDRCVDPSEAICFFESILAWIFVCPSIEENMYLYSSVWYRYDIIPRNRCFQT